MLVMGDRTCNAILEESRTVFRVSTSTESYYLFGLYVLHTNYSNGLGIGKVELEEVTLHLRGGGVENLLGTSISPSSAVELYMTSAFDNYATEAGTTSDGQPSLLAKYKKKYNWGLCFEQMTVKLRKNNVLLAKTLNMIKQDKAIMERENLWYRNQITNYQIALNNQRMALEVIEKKANECLPLLNSLVSCMTTIHNEINKKKVLTNRDIVQPSAHSTHHTTKLPNSTTTTIVLPDGQSGNSKDPKALGSIPSAPNSVCEAVGLKWNHNQPHTLPVKPMVSGYTIYKPKVRLQRVNLSLPLMSHFTQESRDTVCLHTSNVLRRRTYPTNALDLVQTPQTVDIEDEPEDSPDAEETTLTNPTIVSPLIEEDDDFEDLTVNAAVFSVPKHSLSKNQPFLASYNPSVSLQRLSLTNSLGATINLANSLRVMSVAMSSATRLDERPSSGSQPKATLPASGEGATNSLSEERTNGPTTPMRLMQTPRGRRLLGDIDVGHRYPVVPLQDVGSFLDDSNSIRLGESMFPVDGERSLQMSAQSASPSTLGNNFKSSSPSSEWEDHDQFLKRVYSENPLEGSSWMHQSNLGRRRKSKKYPVSVGPGQGEGSYGGIGPTQPWPKSKGAKLFLFSNFLIFPESKPCQAGSKTHELSTTKVNNSHEITKETRAMPDGQKDPRVENCIKAGYFRLLGQSVGTIVVSTVVQRLSVERRHVQCLEFWMEPFSFSEVIEARVGVHEDEDMKKDDFSRDEVYGDIEGCCTLPVNTHLKTVSRALGVPDSPSSFLPVMMWEKVSAPISISMGPGLQHVQKKHHTSKEPIIPKQNIIDKPEDNKTIYGDCNNESEMELTECVGNYVLSHPSQNIVNVVPKNFEDDKNYDSVKTVDSSNTETVCVIQNEEREVENVVPIQEVGNTNSLSDSTSNIVTVSKTPNIEKAELKIPEKNKNCDFVITTEMIQHLNNDDVILEDQTVSLLQSPSLVLSRIDDRLIPERQLPRKPVTTERKVVEDKEANRAESPVHRGWSEEEISDQNLYVRKSSSLEGNDPNDETWRPKAEKKKIKSKYSKTLPRYLGTEPKVAKDKKWHSAEDKIKARSRNPKVVLKKVSLNINDTFVSENVSVQSYPKPETKSTEKNMCTTRLCVPSDDIPLVLHMCTGNVEMNTASEKMVPQDQTKTLSSANKMTEEGEGNADLILELESEPESNVTTGKKHKGLSLALFVNMATKRKALIQDIEILAIFIDSSIESDQFVSDYESTDSEFVNNETEQELYSSESERSEQVGVAADIDNTSLNTNETNLSSGRPCRLTKRKQEGIYKEQPINMNLTFCLMTEPFLLSVNLDCQYALPSASFFSSQKTAYVAARSKVSLLCWTSLTMDDREIGGFTLRVDIWRGRLGDNAIKQ
uniref:(California timema) hypothetical protein n=1 Tax=Timema californicum TaxID=61474 RepID=A0A7R9P5A6_TIMCA|nr:unnamed protein product [Timema californicum]